MNLHGSRTLGTNQSTVLGRLNGANRCPGGTYRRIIPSESLLTRMAAWPSPESLGRRSDPSTQADFGSGRGHAFQNPCHQPPPPPKGRRDASIENESFLSPQLGRTNWRVPRGSPGCMRRAAVKVGQTAPPLRLSALRRAAICPPSALCRRVRPRCVAGRKRGHVGGRARECGR